ncbi:MAG TPA: 23S rRNA (guanosine(2251)-2'-O)-methyltransferase RlmB [Nitrospira sp.]|jgi:23S rRNA (guanosine2251-2'-O)-methyltransferase|nr:23S rRNA (guanosine(2251)-2'-O)-methyltransferase RlmB [Nitrospira sp.]
MAPAAGNDNPPEVIYGLHAVREALRAGVRPLQRVLVLAVDRQFGDIVRLAKERRVPVHIEPRAAFDRFVPDGHHQGIIGLVAAKGYADPDDILSSAQAKGQTPLLVVLDGVEDPHNLGAILRTAEASGVQGVFIPERRAVGLTSVVAKASAGAVDYLPVGRVPNLSRLIERFQASGIWVYALDPQGPKVYTALDFRGPVALVFGGEGKGVRPGVRETCDDTAHIPMLGRVGSLNVSASAAAVLYEALRQRRTGSTRGST